MVVESRTIHYCRIADLICACSCQHISGNFHHHVLVNRAGIKTGLKRHSGYRGSPAVGRCVSHVNEEVGCDEYIHQWHDNTCKIKVAGG